MMAEVCVLYENKRKNSLQIEYFEHHWKVDSFRDSKCHGISCCSRKVQWFFNTNITFPSSFHISSSFREITNFTFPLHFGVYSLLTLNNFFDEAKLILFFSTVGIYSQVFSLHFLHFSRLRQVQYNFTIHSMNDWVENEKEVESRVKRKNFTNVIKIHPKSTDERNWFNVIIGLNGEREKWKN